MIERLLLDNQALRADAAGLRSRLKALSKQLEDQLARYEALEKEFTTLSRRYLELKSLVKLSCDAFSASLEYFSRHSAVMFEMRGGPGKGWLTKLVPLKHVDEIGHHLEYKTPSMIVSDWEDFSDFKHAPGDYWVYRLAYPDNWNTNTAVSEWYGDSQHASLNLVAWLGKAWIAGNTLYRALAHA